MVVWPPLGLALASERAAAQPQNPPPYSPYLNLNRPGATAAQNYFGLVRPELEFRNAYRVIQQQVTATQFNMAQQVDPKTGTIKVATLFPNPGNLLRPGQFAKVRARVGLERNALLVPQRAVAEMQGKLLVAVVGRDNKASIRPVETGQRVGSLQVVSKGLQPGEKVVAEGIQKVKEGMTVTPKPFVLPDNTGAEKAGKTAAGQPAPAPAEKR